jgi:hypothetical protein
VTRPATSGRLLRGLSGTAAGGLVALFVVLLVGWMLTTRTGSAGPGTGMLVGHGLAAAAAVVAQVAADRRRDGVATLCSLGILALAVVVLCGYWLF